jgi:two-component system sensor kinase FixL
VLVAGAGIGLLVGLISAIRTSRSITTRIRRLQEATVRVGQGHLETRLPLASDDEIGRLTGAFDRMVRNVEESTQRLECEIEQRRKAEARQAETLKQLEQANADLTDFAHVVSHDLKAPLRGIKMLTEWLCTDYRDQLSDEAAENLNLLESRVKRMYELIGGILQYSRVGRIKEDVVTVDLDALLPDIIDLISPPENIAVEIDGPLPAIQSERTRITQVFQNLLSNAVKYMDKPVGRVVVGCSQDDNAWTFSVSDNGPGIEQKHFDRIFKIFQTLDGKDDFESTGVGLTLVKKIVERYGGSVWVVSDVGQGSTFFFTWPKHVVPADKPVQPAIESRS